jgi:long-chain acyl-CoA synthetase
MMMRYLYEHAGVRPEHPAIVYRDERIGFAELVERVERLAAGLAERGVAPGDAVALLLPNDPSFVVSWHAVTALGAIVVPVNPAFKQDELEFTFRKCDVKVVISDERTAGVCERIVAGFDRPVEVIPTTAAHGQSLTLDMLTEGSSPARLEQRGPDEVYLYQFSSGSTGRPKRVPRTHAQARACSGPPPRGPRW